jgi:hypothetical protein
MIFFSLCKAKITSIALATVNNFNAAEKKKGREISNGI